MQQSSTLFNSVLKGIFFIHLVFTSWGLQSDWAPTSYFFYNLLFMMVLLWGLHQQESEQPIVIAFYFDIVCFVLDIVNVGVFFPSRSGISPTSKCFIIHNILFQFHCLKDQRLDVSVLEWLSSICCYVL